MKISYDTLLRSDLRTAILYLVYGSSIENIDLLSFIRNKDKIVNAESSQKEVFNPILLCSTLAASRVLQTDYNNYLKNYIERDKPLEYDIELLTFEGLRHNDPAILEILKLEERCIEVFIEEIGLVLLAYERINTISKYPSTIWDCYRCCWQALNGKGNNNSLTNQCHSWGATYNDWIHKLRVYYEQGIDDINKLLNKVLSEPFNKENFENCLYVKKKFSLLVKRFYNLYYWNPLEIDAFATESKVAFLLNENTPYKLSQQQQTKLYGFEQRIQNN